jgi:hypothetical protein
MSDVDGRGREVAGHQINCAVCGAFIQFVWVNKPYENKPCPKGCTIEVRRPRLSGVITDLKVPE